MSISSTSANLQLDIKHYSFSHSEIAISNKSKLWQIYTDVKNWKSWDIELEWSSLDVDFLENATGYLKSKGSPKIKFTLKNVINHSRFDIICPIPFGQLVIEHYIEDISENQIKFTHFVYFTGVLASVFDFLLGKKFRRSLPIVMKNLKTSVE